MDTSSQIPYIYWLFWGLFSLVLYAGLYLWWKKEIQQVDKDNLEKYKRLKNLSEGKDNTYFHEN